MVTPFVVVVVVVMSRLINLFRLVYFHCHKNCYTSTGVLSVNFKFPKSQSLWWYSWTSVPSLGITHLYEVYSYSIPTKYF
jgi:hypothetical protein